MPGPEGEVIEGSISENLVAFGVTKVTETFKLVVSNKRFDTSLLRMSPLGEPQPQFRNTDLSAVELMLAKAQTRSLNVKSRAAGAFDDWNTSELTLKMELTS